jgi:polyvinyl alcohol dehydrogenase (cytochrome)
MLLAGQKSGDVYALDPNEQGNVIWRTRIGSGSALGGVHWGMAVTVSNDLVFAPALDGQVLAFASATGELLWYFDTAREFKTVSGALAHGGAMDNVGVMFADDMVFMQSGYELFGQLPGNVLLAFKLRSTDN